MPKKTITQTEIEDASNLKLAALYGFIDGLSRAAGYAIVAFLVIATFKYM